MAQAESKNLAVEALEETRVDSRNAFIGQSSWGDAKVLPLQQDVSVRKFFRLEQEGKTSILMDARPPLEDTAMFEFVRNKLDTIGLNVPEVYETDHSQGFVIMEDFGDERCYDLLVQNKVDLTEMYSALVDVLVHKCCADPKVALAQSVAYSDDYWLLRVEQFLLHYMPHVVGRDATQTERDDFLGLFRKAIEGAHQLDDVLLHGDFGVQNIYYFPEREGVQNVGLIDFQDMTDARGNMMGSPAFDLAFLLQDVRTAVADDLEQVMKQRFIEKTGLRIDNLKDFNTEYATIGTAQSVKCLGLFARLGYVDGRKEYLQFLPNCLNNLRRNFVNPELKGIKEWFEKVGVEVR